MTLKPKKKQLLPALVILSTTLGVAAQEKKPILSTVLSTVDLVTQESYLLASCTITCASTCGLTNKC